jgi:YHS domain-containing protein
VKRAVILGATLLALAACSTDRRLLAPDHEAQRIISPEKNSATVKRGTDPVCGADMNHAVSFWQTSYEGTEYYFDSEECRRQFHENPELFSGAVR